MSKVTTRDVAPHDRGSIEQRLARWLETPSLARVVPHLPPETLHQLIRYRGLDACGELIASATPAQLGVLLDLDLWGSARAGHDHRFDVERFGEWLEALVEAGSAVAAGTVAALDAELVVAGLSRYVRVFDPGIFEPTAQSDDEAPDRRDAMREGDALHGPRHASAGAALECEVGGYLVRARRVDAWDAIVELLVALDTEHSEAFHAVMHGCRRVSNSRPEIDGLDDVLMAPEQQLHDVAIARERRQSQQGYATPADARAFLQMARQRRHTRSDPATTAASAVNPIATAYFRAANDGGGAPAETAPPGAAVVASPASDVAEALGAAVELLTEAGVMPGRPRALLPAADSDPQDATQASLRRLMAHVRDADDAIELRRSRELAFLANTLLAGCSVQSRPFSPPEAADAAAAICNLGLEHWPTAPRVPLPDAFLVDHDLLGVFELGWSVLHEVGLFVADQLLAALDHLYVVDRDLQLELAVLRRTLVKHRDAGTPWLARGALDVLTSFDMAAWASLRGLLDECPVLPAALTAVLDGRTRTVSPTAFAFIATADQIGAVRRFMRRLPELLSR